MMAETFDIHAWIALFIGLYALAAGVGELRAPGSWQAMLTDFERSPGLRFVTGFAVLALGAAIYLVNPWLTDDWPNDWPNDWLAIVASIAGGVMIAEGALLLAAGDRFIKLGFRVIGRSSKAWAGFSSLLGAALILTAISRL